MPCPCGTALLLDHLFIITLSVLSAFSPFLGFGFLHFLSSFFMITL